MPYSALKAIQKIDLAHSLSLGIDYVVGTAPQDLVEPFRPPLVINEDEIDLLAQRFETALEATWTTLQA